MQSECYILRLLKIDLIESANKLFNSDQLKEEKHLFIEKELYKKNKIESNIPNHSKIDQTVLKFFPTKIDL